MADSFTGDAFRNPIDSHFSVLTVSLLRFNQDVILWISSAISFSDFLFILHTELSSARRDILLFVQVDGRSFI